jgi:hypothetical protein
MGMLLPDSAWGLGKGLRLRPYFFAAPGIKKIVNSRTQMDGVDAEL